MSDSVNIALRCALYLDLMLLFGLALFGLYNLKGREPILTAALPTQRLLAGTAGLGILLSLASIVWMTSAMSGEADVYALRPHIEMMLYETEVGFTWAVRLTALLIAGLAVMPYKRAPSTSLLITALAGGIALATLAWNGHGAMDEGSRRYWHFTADILHLLAAGGWFGALVAFVLLLQPTALLTEERVRLLARGVTRFESMGAIIVVVIVVTGAANYLFIVGPKLDDIFLGTYGLLLLLKIGLFAGMLALAALNRFHLGPRLEKSLQEGLHAVAATALKRSVMTELCVAVLIVALVAWLGTLSPLNE